MIIFHSDNRPTFLTYTYGSSCFQIQSKWVATTQKGDINMHKCLKKTNSTSTIKSTLFGNKQSAKSACHHRAALILAGQGCC